MRDVRLNRALPDCCACMQVDIGVSNFLIWNPDIQKSIGTLRANAHKGLLASTVLDSLQSIIPACPDCHQPCNAFVGSSMHREGLTITSIAVIAGLILS